MNLKETREYLKLSQEKVSKELKIHRTTLARIENGESPLRAEHISVLAKLFKISDEEVLKSYNECRKKRQGGF